MPPAILLWEHPRIASDAHFNDVANAPLSACLMSGYIASALRQHDYDVRIYEGYLAGDSFEESFSEISRAEYDLLGVHAVYFWEHTSELFSFLKRLKAVRPEAPLVLYGVFPTFGSTQILQQFGFIDAVIIGEPEETFLEVAACLARSGRLSPDVEIPGLACMHGVIPKTGMRRQLIEPLDGLPFPARSELFTATLGGIVLGSRGCSGRCSFCCINPFYGEGSIWRGRSSANIAAEIETLLPHLDRKYIYFVDANFFGEGPAGRDRAHVLIERLGDFSLEFGLECRCADIDDRLLGLMVASGLRDVFLGIESASAQSRNRMNKSISPTQISRAVQLLRGHGIEPTPGFIMFEWGSTLEDIRMNFEFLKTQGLLRDLACSADLLYHREIMLKGMPNFQRHDAAGRLSTKDALGYEGFYEFADPSVQLLADVMSTVCRRVLKSRESSRSPLCWKKGPTAASRKTHDFIVASFEKMLRMLELGELPLSSDMRLRLEEDAIAYLEGVIVEDRVCQS